MSRRTLLSLLTLLVAGCDRLPIPGAPSPTPTAHSPSPTATAAPTPTPTPTPPPPTPVPTPLVPRKPMNVGKMFNGITYKTKFATPASKELASVDRTEDDSYEVEITFTAKLPRPSTTMEDLASNDPKLPHVLNQMDTLVSTAKVSSFFERLYKIKINTVRDDLFSLNEVLSRHNFYDCETILEMKSPETGRKALLIIGDMDVNVDGSDGDRNFAVDDSGRFFQPQTSYRWRKTTKRVNPLLPKIEKRIEEQKAELKTPDLSSQRRKDLNDAIAHNTRTVSDLKSASFLISAADPTIVVPGFMLKDDSAYAPSIGDYAAVIYDGVIYPTIVGDAGPSAKVGEASLRLCQQINPRSSSISRSVSNIKAAYLIFPGTAEKAAQPDLAKWREKCRKYLDELGGSAPELFVWDDIVPPWPTPTPTPTPPPTPTPSPAASPEMSPTPSPDLSASPSTGTPPSEPEPSTTPDPVPDSTPEPSAVITPPNP